MNARTGSVPWDLSGRTKSQEETQALLKEQSATINKAKQITTAVISTLQKGGDYLAIYETIYAALKETSK